LGGLAVTQPTGCVIHGAPHAFGRSKLVRVEAFVAQLTQGFILRPIHPRGAGHTGILAGHFPNFFFCHSWCKKQFIEERKKPINQKADMSKCRQSKSRYFAPEAKCRYAKSRFVKKTIFKKPIFCAPGHTKTGFTGAISAIVQLPAFCKLPRQFYNVQLPKEFCNSVIGTTRFGREFALLLVRYKLQNYLRLVAPTQPRIVGRK
jgi:hypothetical protein